MLNDKTIAAFKAQFRGAVVEPGDATYDEARKVYNAMIDKRPRLVAQCADVADVITAVNFGRDNGLLVAVRGGGHNGPGFGTCDGGLVIDLAGLKGVRVDQARSQVRVEPGCTQGDVDHATHAFGLAVPAGIVGSTGVAGLTLGGGHGYLTRQYGLTIDNLLEVDLVLADGRLVTASERENSDLFWAVRGGGGNFGVVTSFLFRAHPVKNVYGGPIFWDLKQAKEVMRFYRDFLPNAPEKLSIFIGLKIVPPVPVFPQALWGKRICGLFGCYTGTQAEGQKAMKPVRDALPKPLLDGMGEIPFPALQSMFDPLLPKGLQWYWKGSFIRELTDAAIDVVVEHAGQSPEGLSLTHLYPIDGAAHRVASDATAWSARDAKISMVIAAIDPDPAKAGALKRWGREYWQAVQKVNPGTGYLNFMMDDEGDDRVRAIYGANYKRLQQVKKKFDPANFFRVNQNILPA